MMNQPIPARLFATMGAYQHTAALRTGIHLELFTAIAEGNTEVPQIAKRTAASERGIHILCDFLTIMGFLTKTGESYGLAEDAMLFLNKHSPAYMGSVDVFLGSDMITNAFAGLTEAVRKGSTALGDQGSMAPDHPCWVDFARGMAPMMFMPATMIATAMHASEMGPIKVLDIAASHGMYGLAFAKANAQAQIYAVDWASVLAVGEENAARFGVGDRFHKIVGSAFDVDLGSDYDVILLPNFLHHFDKPTCIMLLQRMRAALKPGGRLATAEFVPNDDRVSPPGAASFSLTMLVSTDSGDAYTFKEFDEMFRAAGFGSSEMLELIPGTQSVIVTSTAA